MINKIYNSYLYKKYSNIEYKKNYENAFNKFKMRPTKCVCGKSNDKFFYKRIELDRILLQ